MVFQMYGGRVLAGATFSPGSVVPRHWLGVGWLLVVMAQWCRHANTNGSVGLRSRPKAEAAKSAFPYSHGVWVRG